MTKHTPASGRTRGEGRAVCRVSLAGSGDRYRAPTYPWGALPVTQCGRWVGEVAMVTLQPGSLPSGSALPLVS